MARDRANINTNIWTDTHWRSLTRDQHWLYVMLLTHTELSYAGVTDWRPGRLMQFAAGTSRQDIERLGQELQAERFIFIDEDTEEVMIRSFIRHDGLLKNPKITVSMVNAYGAIASNKIREVFVHELNRLHTEQPDLKAFENAKVLALLKNPARPMQEFTQGFTPSILDDLPQALPQGLGEGLPQTQGTAFPLPTTTATTTSITNVIDGGAGETLPDESAIEEGDAKPRKPELPLPKNWAPTKAHWELAKKKNLNLEAEATNFRLHAETHDRRARVWNAAFTTWLTKAQPKQATAWG